MKTTRHSLLAKGILVLLSLLILVFVFTYSWYASPATPVVANGMSFSTSTTITFDIAIGFSSPDTGNQYVITNFTSTDNGIDFEHISIPQYVDLGNSQYHTNPFFTTGSNTINLLEYFEPVDLTGNGSKLIRPDMTTKNRSIDYNLSYSDDIEANRQYISFDIYIRSDKSNFNVSLEKDSYVVSACEAGLGSNYTASDLEGLTVNTTCIDPSDLIGGSVARKSTYGNFSEDSVVGAVRIAFTEYTGTVGSSVLSNANFFDDTSAHLEADPSLLWIPRSDIFLKTTNNLTDWVLKKTGDADWATAAQGEYPDHAADDGYTHTGSYADIAATHMYYDYTKIADSPNHARYTTMTASDGVVSNLTTATNRRVFSAMDGIHIGNNYYGKAKFNLWIEGCDAEARKAIDGGKFFFGLSLSANG